MKTKEEFNLDKELEKWFYRWHRKVVTGRCLIELKNRDKEFIRILKKGLGQQADLDYDMDLIKIEELIDELAGEFTK